MIETLLNPALYDDHSTDYYGLLRVDDRLVLPLYADFVQEVCSNGNYSDMLNVLALTAVVQKPIQTTWPITAHANVESPMTKFVCGRGVETVLPVHILWTTASCTDPPVINHFVPMIALTAEINVADAAAEHDGDGRDSRR